MFRSTLMSSLSPGYVDLDHELVIFAVNVDRQPERPAVALTEPGPPQETIHPRERLGARKTGDRSLASRFPAARLSQKDLIRRLADSVDQSGTF